MKLDPKIGRSLKKASPTILTCIGAAGVVATAVLAVKATPKADSLIKADSRRNHDGDPYAATKLEAVKSCWKCYIPAAATGVATIICIFGANTLNKKQQASLASAYALVNRSYSDYKHKLKELYGEDAHKKIMESIAAEKSSMPPITATGGFSNSSLEFEDANEEQRLFYDSFSKRYFQATISQVLQAEYHINRNKVTLSAGSTINWASVTNQNLTSNPAYSLASTANANAATAKSAADDAYDEASAAWSRANKAYQDRCTDQNVFDVLTSGGTKFGIFSDSYSGRLYINADYIRSGTINADYIDLSCDYGGFCKGHGSDGQHTTYGAMMYGSNGPGWEPYIIVTNAGARISGTGADLVVSGGITMSEEPSYGSDLRIKNSIDYDLASYEAFFLALKPSTFKYNKGTSGRKHFGFIAQDVEQAMLDTGLTSDQLAALVKDPVKEILSDGITDYRYSIRYGELIALNTHMIQKLYQMVEELLQQKEG